MTDTNRIAICGGTFDPFHRGHHEPVASVRQQFEWTRVFFVPAFIQPFKADLVTASPFHRFAMCALATIDDAWAEVAPWELERGSVSYTIDTVEALSAQLPDATLDLIIGDDNLPTLEAWRNLDRIFELANFVVLTRGNAALPPALAGRVRPAGAPRSRSGAIVFAENTTVPVSSTEIRRRVREHQPLESLVDPRVAQYIQRNRLYQ